MDLLQVWGKPLPKFRVTLLGTMDSEEVMSMISNRGMWNRMQLYEAQIPDTYLFAHSSLLDDLWPTTVCFCSPPLPGSFFFSCPVRENKADSLPGRHVDMQREAAI